MALDEQMRNKIAYDLYKLQAKDGNGEGIIIDNSFRRRAGNYAARTGNKLEDVLEFMTTLATEVLSEVAQNGKPFSAEERTDAENWHRGH